ncbi:MAG: hypothetical protein RR414_09130, partial [Oscillospiraceae bacterium]
NTSPAHALANMTPAHALADTTAAQPLTNKAIFDYSNPSRVLIISKVPVRYIYLKHKTPPMPYFASFGGASLQCGQDGFLHELIDLESPSHEIELSISGDTLLSAIPYSEGLLPFDVQHWQRAQGKCDMLLFPTHADDDTLYFGAAIAIAVARKKTVQVAYLIHHSDTADRHHELLDGLWSMGVKRYPVSGLLPDFYSPGLEHARTIYDTEEILSYQVEQLRAFRPSVVIGHDIEGEYGHGAHMLNADTLIFALDAAADPSRFPDSAQRHGGTHNVPKAYLHNAKEGAIILDVHTPLEYFDGLSAFEVAQLGYSKHLSQHQWSSLSVKDYGTDDCRTFGLVRTLVGADTGNDMFEHIAGLVIELPPLYQPRQPATEEILDNDSVISVPVALAVIIISACCALIALIAALCIRSLKRRSKHNPIGRK